VGSEEGVVRRHFRERTGRQGGERTRGSIGGCVRSVSSRGRRKPGGAHVAAGEKRGRSGGPALGRGQVGHGWVEIWRWVKSQKDIAFEFQLILEFGRTLENYTRRFRKKFDMGIFPKIF
jgi:hypothetical protein